ncbi:MAG: hypothetical protein HFF39_09920 [Lawsonibacter sp.]|nr:hypothetical protein [Lawsonibacter sp.]
MKQNRDKGISGIELVKNREAISRLAQSSDAQQLMQLLQRGGGVQEAAQAAADGDPSELIRRMQQLMNTKEGAQLVERISRQAKESGLTGE